MTTTSSSLARYARDPVAFIKKFITRNELGQPFVLQPFQEDFLRLAYQFDPHGRLVHPTGVAGLPKKSGKSTLVAAVADWWGFTQEPPNEIIICANDLDQSIGRVFKAAAELIRQNPQLRRSADIQSRQIALTNGTIITAIASDYAGAAGSNHGLTVWDELWGYTSEGSRRLWDELTPVPTRRNSARLIATYAGFEGESNLLWDLYRLGVGKDEHPDGQGIRLHPTLPLYGNREAGLLVCWDHEPRMPWQTPDYYAAQRQMLRPSTYLRLHENRWVTAESIFIRPDQWDGCVEAGLSPLMPTRVPAMFVGVDAGIKHDTAAVVAVYWLDDKLTVAQHRIWKPSPQEPLDIEATIETFLRDLHARYRVVDIVVDPYQLHRTITSLRGAGLKIREFPQTTGNTTQMGQTLFDLLNGRNLRLYPADDLRRQALHTVAVENPRGWRIAKEKASRKIDAIVALAMAAVAAIDGKDRAACSPGSPILVGDTRSQWGGSSDWQGWRRSWSDARTSF